jgi:predicted phage terminase large subunit-like protein
LEIQQLDFESCIYLFSRLRSTTVDYPLQIRATGNPSPDAWIKQLVQSDLDHRGIPLPERRHDPKKKWFVNTPNGIEIFHTLEEAQAVYGKGKESGIMSFLFQPGDIYSNPILMREDPSYVTRLKALPRVEMERLLMGSWEAREQGASFFNREHIQIVQHPNMKANKRVRAWDQSSTKSSEANPNPDFSVGVLMSRDRDGVLTVEDVIRFRDVPHVVKQTIFETAYRDGPEVQIALELDPGALAGAYIRQMQRELSERGFTVKLFRPSKAKVQRFRPFAAIAEARFVNIVEAPWNIDYLNELEAFGSNNKIKDDQVDATSTATYFLTQEANLPSFSLPNDLAVASYGPQFGFQSTALPTEMTQGLPLGFN